MSRKRGSILFLLTNTTGLTLDSGSFSVIEQEAFAGCGRT
jgi:hypothetical protein